MSDDKIERVRRRAYDIWEQEGQPEGRHDAHWSEAERAESDGEHKVTPTPKNEGEGSQTGARDYNDATRHFVADGRVEGAAREAADAVAGPEAESLKRAEDAGKRRGRGEDPALKK